MSVAIPSVMTRLEKRARRKRRKKTQRRGEPYPIEKTRSGGGKKSKRKGANFEATIAKLFSAYYGCSVRRTPGSGGWSTVGGFGPAGDLVFADRRAPYHVEAKRHENWDIADLITGVRSADTTATNSIEKWWTQTTRDCPKGKIPMLIFARNSANVGRAANVGIPPLLMLKEKDLRTLSIRKKDSISIWNTSDFIRALHVVTDAEDKRVIVSLADFFKFVRPPKRSPRRKTWVHGVG